MARLSFVGRFATSAAELDRLVHTAPATSPVADISLGSAAAHSVARQYFGQLGLALPRLGQTFTPGRSRYSYADLISQGVDAESAGNRVVRAASCLARLLSSSPTALTPLVILPQQGVPFEEEDILLLSFLAHRLRPGAIRLICYEPAPPVLPDDWDIRWENEPRPFAPAPAPLLSLVPGSLDPRLAEYYRSAGSPSAVCLLRGWLVVPPETRPRLRDIPKLEWDRLAAWAKSIDSSLAAFAQLHGNSFYVDPAALCAEAWSQFAEGGIGLALRYLALARDCATGAEGKARVQAQMQGVRIAQSLFTQAAGEPEPPTSVSTPLRAFLLQAKGWGHVQSGAAAEARKLFARSADLLRGAAVDPRENMYLTNILALAEYREGNTREALRLERLIESQLHTGEVGDDQLIYINSINQARIYRAVGEWPSARTYYDRAFGSTWGLRTESDLVYSNVCLARLDEQCGRHADALLAWVRAAMHWLAARLPESLSWRIAQALLPGRQGPVTRYPDCVRFVDEISGALLLNIERAAKQRQFPTPPPGRRPKRFARVEDVTQPILHAAVGGEGWSVFAATAPADPEDRGESYDRLRDYLSAWVDAAGEAPEGDTYLVDARCGRELAVAFHELIETCIRREVSVVWYGGRRLSLDPVLATALRGEMIVRLARGVRAVTAGDPPTVRFRRYLPARRLTEDEARVVHELQRGSTSLRFGHPVIRTLEEGRIVECLLESQACAAAGIKWPSSES